LAIVIKIAEVRTFAPEMIVQLDLLEGMQGIIGCGRGERHGTDSRQRKSKLCHDSGYRNSASQGQAGNGRARVLLNQSDMVGTTSTSSHFVYPPNTPKDAEEADWKNCDSDSLWRI
jgi:hypothetical protein